MKGKYNKAPLILIGGIDPTGNAGLFADAKVLQYYNIPFRAVPTAITAQSDTQFFGSKPVAISLFRKQLNSLPNKIQGVKIGMIATLQHAKVMTQWLEEKKPKYVVWDPVICSSSGGRLLDTKRWNPTLQKLLQYCSVLTPNLPEAEWILQQKLNLKKPRQAMQKATQELFRQFKEIASKAILLKGGHIPNKSYWVEDILWDGKKFYHFRSQKSSRSPRGTGCTLATALLTELSLDQTLFTATDNARKYVKKNLFNSTKDHH